MNTASENAKLRQEVKGLNELVASKTILIDELKADKAEIKLQISEINQR